MVVAEIVGDNLQGHANQVAAKKVEQHGIRVLCVFTYCVSLYHCGHPLSYFALQVVEHAIASHNGMLVDPVLHVMMQFTPDIRATAGRREGTKRGRTETLMAGRIRFTPRPLKRRPGPEHIAINVPQMLAHDAQVAAACSDGAERQHPLVMGQELTEQRLEHLVHALPAAARHGAPVGRVGVCVDDDYDDLARVALYKGRELLHYVFDADKEVLEAQPTSRAHGVGRPYHSVAWRKSEGGPS